MFKLINDSRRSVVDALPESCDKSVPGRAR